MPKKDPPPPPGPKETRHTLRAVRRTAAEIVAEQNEIDAIEKMVKVMERHEQRIKFEADELRRKSELRKEVGALRAKEKEREELVRKMNEERIQAVKKHCNQEKIDAKARLKKPTVTTETTVSKLNKVRRVGGAVIAANSKSFGTSFAAVVSGKLGESILKDMKIHRTEQIEERLRREAETSVQMSALMAHIQLDPCVKERKDAEKRLKDIKRRVEASSQLLGAMEPPHSPLLARRPLTAGSLSRQAGQTAQFQGTMGARPGTAVTR